MGGEVTKQRICQVLDYWRFMDMLSQDKLPKPERAEHEKGGDLPKSHFARLAIPATDTTDKPFTERIREEIDSCNSVLECYQMTLHLGKVPRDAFVSYIAEMRGDEERLVDRGDDRIALAMIRLNPDGTLLSKGDKNSSQPDMDVAPAAWFAIQTAAAGTGIAADRLDMDSYDQWVEQLNDDLRERFGDQPLTPAGVRASNRELFGRLQMKLGRRFTLDKDKDADAINYLLLSFTAYAEPPAESSRESLCNAFFAEDIEAVRHAIKPESADPTLEQLRAGSLGPLIRYIEAGLFDDGRASFDMLKGDTAGLQRMYEAILDPSNTPLGRWPSKYGLSLMQQCAVNLTVGRQRRACYDLLEEPGDPVADDIMSVNGPPGTGKTTLLKDVVAANIVERARMLAQLENPDDLFEERSFEHIPAEYGGHYLGYHPHFYAIKPEYDDLNDLGVVVCSSNNAAVENVSEELPKGAELVGGLLDEGQDVSPLIDELERCFSANGSEGRSVAGYFSDCALAQFDSSSEAADATDDGSSAFDMLIAARLGNKKNVDAFCWNALFQVIKQQGKKEQRHEPQKNEYRDARNAFISQLERVKRLSDEAHERLSAVSEAPLIELEGRIGQTEKELEQVKSDIGVQDEMVRKLEGSARSLVANACRECNLPSWQASDDRSRHTFWHLLKVVGDSLASTSRAQSKRPFLRGIKRSRPQGQNLTRLEEAWAALGGDTADLVWMKGDEALPQRINEMVHRGVEAERALQDALASYASLDESRRMREHVLHALGEDYAERHERRRALQGGIPEHKLKEDGTPFGTYERVSRSLIEDLCSDDVEKRKQAHLSDPGFLDPKTNGVWERDLPHQRDLLFFAALRFLQEFVLSSDHLQSNFRNLYAMWGGHEVHTKPEPNEDTSDEGKEGTNKKKGKAEYVAIHFSAEDRKLAMPCLLQSLFILTPVVSTTFASAHRLFKDVRIDAQDEAPFGLLIIDEAGQAVPEAAVGMLARCRRSLIVGDPLQIDPVVKDELDLLRGVWGDHDGTGVPDAFTSKTASVQKFADCCNPFGSWKQISDGEDEGQWVGCPLIVHRRCISPMFDISNRISYGGTMLNETALPGSDREERFCWPSSQWLDCLGAEKGGRNHYVKRQGQEAIELIKEAFDRKDSSEDLPSLYVISPFKTVANELKREMRKSEMLEGVSKKQREAFIKNNIGTVHTFQGKEADQVIFLLGCDSTASGAVKWVKPNIVNVAVSRAKFRLYVIGSYRVWRDNPSLDCVKEILDTQWIAPYRKWKAATDEQKRDQYLEEVARLLPSLESLPQELASDSDFESGFYSTKVFREMSRRVLSKQEFKEALIPTDKACRLFGYKSRRDLEDFYHGFAEQTLTGPGDRSKRWAELIIENLESGIALYSDHGIGKALAKRKDMEYRNFMASFCSAAECYLNLSIFSSLQQLFPEYEVNTNKPLRDANKLMLGKMKEIVFKKRKELGETSRYGDEELGFEVIHDENWWRELSKLVDRFRDDRNKVGHGDEKVGYQCALAICTYLFHTPESPRGWDIAKVTHGLMHERDGFLALAKGIEEAPLPQIETANQARRQPKKQQGKQNDEPEKDATLKKDARQKHRAYKGQAMADGEVIVTDDTWPKSLTKAIKWAQDKGLWPDGAPTNAQSLHVILKDEFGLITKDARKKWVPTERAIQEQWGIVRFQDPEDENKVWDQYTKDGISRIAGALAKRNNQPNLVESASADSSMNAVLDQAQLTEREAKVLSLAAWLKRDYTPLGKSLMSAILRGCLTKRVLDRQYDNIPTFGKLSDYSDDQVIDQIDALVSAGLLSVRGGRYRVLDITPEGERRLKAYAQSNKRKGR